MVYLDKDDPMVVSTYMSSTSPFQKTTEHNSPQQCVDKMLLLNAHRQVWENSVDVNIKVTELKGKKHTWSVSSFEQHSVESVGSYVHLPCNIC